MQYSSEGIQENKCVRLINVGTKVQSNNKLLGRLVHTYYNLQSCLHLFCCVFACSHVCVFV